MRLEQALHERWAADARLAELIPPANVWTGWQTPTPLPSASLLCVGEDHLWLTPKREWAERVRITVTIWSESFDRLRKAIDRVKVVFNRASFDLGDGARVIRMTVHRTTLHREEHEVWRGEVSFNALALRPATV